MTDSEASLAIVISGHGSAVPAWKRDVSPCEDVSSTVGERDGGNHLRPLASASVDECEAAVARQGVEAHDEARIVSAAFQATAERGARTIPVSLVANVVELARLLTQQPGQWEIDEKVYARRLFARPNPVLRKRDCDRRIGIIRLLYNVDDVIPSTRS